MYYLIIFLLSILFLYVILPLFMFSHARDVRADQIKKPKESYLDLSIIDIEKVDSPLWQGIALTKREINFLSRYPHIKCLDYIVKDDFYYYVWDHRCTELSNVPIVYIKGCFSRIYLKTKVLSGLDPNFDQKRLRITNTYKLDLDNFWENYEEYSYFEKYLSENLEKCLLLK